MCMMESTYAIANSIAGVSGSENVDNKEIVTVPGTNIQSDETPEFDVILKRQKPDCRSILEELKAQMPDAEIRYAYGYFRRKARNLFYGLHGRGCGCDKYQSSGMPGCIYQEGSKAWETADRSSF